MNASQMDPIASPTSNRIVGYASGAYLEAKLAEGYLCGPWSRQRRAYAVMRKPAKRGRKPPLSADLERECMALYAQIAQNRKRIGEIAAQVGTSRKALMEFLAYRRRAASSTRR